MRPDPAAPELRAVAPLVTTTSPAQLVGAVTLVANGDRVVGVTSAELVRPLQGAPLAIVTKLDGSAQIPMASWFMGHYVGIGIVELGGAIPDGHDVVPLAVGSVCASVSTHGAPAAFCRIEQTAAGFTRTLLPIFVDRDDAGGMSDRTLQLASPVEPVDAAIDAEGCPAFAWLPPEPALGRKRGEVVVCAIGFPYRAQIAKPREQPVIAELLPLDDLGRALVVAPPPIEDRAELGEVHGEIDDHRSDPLAGLDD
ncbi:MAG TPA: hypothetical protein VFQ53_07860 [Kofleriaceae bacterium]|nr:hypothetical protein [Kofleriaceae bacterium]